MDLKGADYNKTLLSNTLEGITISPYYHKNTFKKLDIPKFESKTNICQSLFISNASIVNNLVLKALSKGADTIQFIATSIFDYKKIFYQLPKDKNYLLFCNFIDSAFLDKLISFTKEYKVQIIVDPINQLGKEGNWFTSQKTDFEILKKANITIGVDASLYQNAGGNIVQQIAYSLAHANEYLNAIVHNKSKFIFTFSMGSNYFFEISKIRSFKYLFKKLLIEYGFDNSFEIVLKPTLRNKTLYDYNVNMLRTTTESMAAMLCDVNFVTNTAYDSIYHRNNAFGERIARNQLLILKEESYFNQKNDITKGTYFIEQITYELAEKSLLLFKNIEKKGGFLKQLQNSTIQRKIQETAAQEQEQFDTGKLVLLGTNIYLNKEDFMKKELELYPFLKTNPRKTSITPIIPKRLSEKLEQERLNKE